MLIFEFQIVFKCSNDIQMFEFIMLKECGFSACPWKMASSDDVGKNILTGKVMGGGGCVERDVTQEGTRK